MIPTRRPRIRRASEIEITDEDIIEVKPSRSGTYPAVKVPPLRENADPVVRYSLESITDDEDVHIDTALNDVSVALARLSLDDRGASMLRLLGAVEYGDLAPEEAWVVSLVVAGFDLQALIANSPRSEEDTLTLLGRLIEMRVITLVPSKSSR